MMAKHKDAHPAERLAAIRERRREVLEAQRILAARPCTFDEARERIREHLAGVVAMQPVALVEKARWFAAPGAPTAFDAVVPRADDPWLGSFVLDVCKDLVEARLVAALADLDLTDGIREEDRRTEQARIASELTVLERQEEKTVRVLEGMGEDVDRRPDVDVVVVALDDAALEAAVA